MIKINLGGECERAALPPPLLAGAFEQHLLPTNAPVELLSSQWVTVFVLADFRYECVKLCESEK